MVRIFLVGDGMKVIGIAAVGRSGQLGLGGVLPWHHNGGDLRRFRELTTGKVVVLGSVTFDNIFFGMPAWEDRLVLRMSREHTQLYDSGALVGYLRPGVLRIVREFMVKPIEVWIAGGAQVYEAWRPYVGRWDITVNEYNGGADTWMPHLWEARETSPS